MARIPETDIERLKNEISVERLVEASGIALKKSGKDRMGRCPFHEDDTASLVITPAKNLWHCFGCGIGGGPIDWMMKKNGVSFRHAVELLKDGVTSVSSLAAGSATNEGAIKRSTVRALPAPVAQDADDRALLGQVIDYYHQRLKQSPEALAYLEARGLAHPELIDTFRLGVADRSLGLRLPEKNRLAGAEIRTRLQMLGIYRESGHEHFNGSLIVPVLDEHGFVAEVYGRKLRDDLRPGTPKHLYLPGPHAGVWNHRALTAAKEIILCEALIDAMTFWCAGYRNVTSAYGIEGFTDDMLAAFKRHGTERVLIAFDRDEAGERGAQKIAERLMSEGIECFRIQFPKGMDANAYALKVTPASKSLGLLIRKAEWMGKGAAPIRDPVAFKVTKGDLETEAEPLTASAAETEHAEPLPAQRMPDTARDGLNNPVNVKSNEVTLTLGEGTGLPNSARRWRVRGLQKNLAVDVLRINLMVAQGETFHVDTLDLYAAKQRQHYLLQAAAETGIEERVLRADLGRVLLALEQLQDETITKTLTQALTQTRHPEPPSMEEIERTAALALLTSPELVPRLLADLTACGLVGEETNKLVGYLATVSRKLDRPLGVVIQSSSAAGKSSLMDAVLAFVPDEDKVKYSAMTGQSLFYMGETNLKHKALAIVEEEGASRASYALKLLQSEGELTIASTGKDPDTGNLITQQYRVEGPVALLLTTTARDLDEELLNRCLLLAVDEGREQTRAIHQLQRDRRTLAGLQAKRDREALIVLHQNAQRLLRPLDVLNPYAQYLTFPDQTTRLRRDHEKYLTLIDTIAFLHQHQREVKSVQVKGVHHRDTEAQRENQRENQGNPFMEYIEVTLADIELANRIAHDVLGRSLDELPPQTRRLLKLIDGHVVSECERQSIKRADFRFSRRSLREAITWGDTQLKLHLARLAELEYLIPHRTRTGGFEYELVYAMGDADGTLRFPGLADIDQLSHAYDTARSGSNVTRSAPGRGVDGGRSAPGRVSESAAKADPVRTSSDMPNTNTETHVHTGNHKSRSYTQPITAAVANLAAAVN